MGRRRNRKRKIFHISAILNRENRIHQRLKLCTFCTIFCGTMKAWRAPDLRSFLLFICTSSIRSHAGKGLGTRRRSSAILASPHICRCKRRNRQRGVDRPCEMLVGSIPASGHAPKATEHPPAPRDIRWAIPPATRVDACVPTQEQRRRDICGPHPCNMLSDCNGPQENAEAPIT